jgi:hypothetical protein
MGETVEAMEEEMVEMIEIKDIMNRAYIQIS